MSSGKIPFDPGTADIDIARQIVFARLRKDPKWDQLDKTGEGFAPFVEYVPSPGWTDGRPRLLVLAHDVFWQLVCEGVLSPGSDSSNSNLPFFHVTEYGKLVLTSSEPQPYDPTGYLAALRDRIAAPDPTVLAYLAESLETFRRSNLVASTVMLGIAAERVFLLLCDSLEGALSNPSEKSAFAKLVKAFPIKPKLDWAHQKIQQIQNQRLTGFPDNATIMTIAIYDLIRCQRNDLGHPREVPPNVKRADAFVNLQIFPRYFELAEEVRVFLASHPV